MGVGIKVGLEKLEKDRNPIIWDARDLSIQVQVPEWAINPNDSVKTLKSYYVTPDGRDLMEVMITALVNAKNTETTLVLQSSELQDALLF